MPRTTSPSTAAEPDPRQERANRAPVPLLVWLAVVALIVLSQLYGALAIEPTAAAEFGVEPGGLIQLAFGIAYALGFLVWGPIVDRIGARRVLLIGLVGLAVSTAVAALMVSMPWLVVARVLQGTAAASFAPSAFAYIGGRLPVPRRALAITVLTSAFLAAASIGQFAAQAITDTWSWRWFFGLSALLLALAAVIAFALLPDDRAAVRETTPPESASGEAGRWVAILILLLATSVILSPFVGIFAALAAGEYTGESLAVLRLGTFPALIWAGFFATRLARTPGMRRLIAGFVGAALASIALALTAPHPIAVGFCLIVLAACVALLAPSMIQVLAGLAPERRGSVTAMYTFALFLGASVAPAGVAALAPLDSPLALVSTTAFISAAATLSAAGLTVLAHRRIARPASPSHGSNQHERS